MTSVYCLLQVCTAPRVLCLYHNRMAFSAITRNIMTLNLLHTKIFNYLVFRNMRNFIHKIFTYTVSYYAIMSTCFSTACDPWTILEVLHLHSQMGNTNEFRVGPSSLQLVKDKAGYGHS